MSRRVLVKSVVILLVGLWWTASPVAQAAVWTIEIVQGPSSQTLSVTSLAYDSVGNPSIAYGNGAAGEVRFAVRTGGTWNTELVDSRTMAGLELAYDANGDPSVAFTAQQGPGFSVFFARRSGASWSVERVERRVGANAVSLAYDAGGNPVVAYSKNNALILATRVGTSWNTETVESQINVGSEVSLALDPGDGRLSVAYTDDQRSGTGELFLKYAKWNGGSWDVEIVESTSDNKRMTSLAYDTGSGEATIAYWRTLSGPDDVRFARGSGAGSWQVETVASGAGASLAYDNAGSPFVGYRDDDNDQLLIAHHDGAAWQSEVVETSPTTSAYTTRVSVAIDSSGLPSLSYGRRASVSDPRDLRFASQSAGCTVNAECDDSNDCTLDTCDTGSGVCQHVPVADDTSCGGGICCGGACTVAVCSNDADCDDGDTCSTDICFSPGTCAATCDNTFPSCGPADGCCAPDCDATNDPDCPDVCVPTHNNEKGPRCSDGIDNDCDGLIDGDDPDC